MFIIVFVSRDTTLDDNKTIKFEVKFKTLNVLIFDATVAATITTTAKIEMIFLNHEILCFRTKQRVVNSTTFFF